jgi:hypothetical protein
VAWNLLRGLVQQGALGGARGKAPDPAARLAGGADSEACFGTVGGGLGDAGLGEFLADEGDGERALGEEVAQALDGARKEGDPLGRLRWIAKVELGAV